MTYGVKAIHIMSIGESDQRYYEEIILRVEAVSFDEAYSKAAQYLKNNVLDHINPDGERVKTMEITCVDCFLASEPECDVQEIFSTFSSNLTSMTENEYREFLLSGGIR